MAVVFSLSSRLAGLFRESGQGEEEHRAGHIDEGKVKIVALRIHIQAEYEE